MIRSIPWQVKNFPRWKHITPCIICQHTIKPFTNKSGRSIPSLPREWMAFVTQVFECTIITHLSKSIQQSLTSYRTTHFFLIACYFIRITYKQNRITTLLSQLPHKLPHQMFIYGLGPSIHPNNIPYMIFLLVNNNSMNMVSGEG